MVISGADTGGGGGGGGHVDQDPHLPFWGPQKREKKHVTRVHTHAPHFVYYPIIRIPTFRNPVSAPGSTL